MKTYQAVLYAPEKSEECRHTFKINQGALVDRISNESDRTVTIVFKNRKFLRVEGCDLGDSRAAWIVRGAIAEAIEHLEAQYNCPEPA